jgi:uncharacterized phiE125 gp8 family phage protein
MGLQIVTPPAVEPVSLAEAKAHLRVDTTDDDSLIKSLIIAARAYCENYTGRQFITATLKLTLDGFPDALDKNDLAGDGGYVIKDDAILMPRPRLISVTGITYIDMAGATQTLSSSVYKVDTQREPGRLGLAYNQTWPIARDEINAVAITFAAGYGASANDVPQTVKQAMLLLIGHWYENREAVNVGNITGVLALTVEALLYGEKIVGVL